MTRRLVVAVLAFAVVLAVVACVYAWHPALDPIAPPARDRFDAATIARGAELAGVGNCASCHTTATGMPYAGGVPLATPFGTIHGTNLTPHAERGIGRWSEAAFVRAMREGVSRDGHLLYPAFPYTHFTHASDDDLHALYAFVMTRDAAADATPANRLAFPLQWRPLVAGWNLLHFAPARDDDALRTQARTDRGAYLVEALGHCGACHTERDRLGAEKRERRLAGNVIDGWYAPPLDARNPSPVPWTVDALTTYLRTGLVDDHAIAGGPMRTAVAGLSRASADDVAAIARAIVANMGPVDDARSRRAQEARARVASWNPTVAEPRHAAGAAVYATACAGCHDRGRDVSSDGALQMPLAVALYDDDPSSFVRIVRDGIAPADGEVGRVMPAYGTSLSDEQLVALAAWLREAAAAAAPWASLDAVVRRSR